MVRCGNTLKIPLEREKVRRGGGKRHATAAAPEKRRPEGPIPPAPSADPEGHPTPLLTNGLNPVRTHQPREFSPRRHVPIQAFDGSSGDADATERSNGRASRKGKEDGDL
jgi:hypothetical protein